MPQMFTPQERQAKHKTVLLIEDDASIGTSIVQAIVEETPYQAFFVTDSLDALQALQDFKPDLLVIDYRLPHMNGFDLYDSIHTQKNLADIPTIIMSAELPEQEVERRHLIGLHKPFDLDDLFSALHMLLSQK